MCDKVVNIFPFVFNSVPDQFKTHKMCNKVVSEESFMLKYCPDNYKTQEMCDKAVDFYPITLKFVPDWFVTNKMLDKFDNFIFFNGNIYFYDVDSNIMTFLTDDMCFNTLNLNNVNLDNDDNFDEDVP